jgi:hypothetical protein
MGETTEARCFGAATLAPRKASSTVISSAAASFSATVARAWWRALQWMTSSRRAILADAEGLESVVPLPLICLDRLPEKISAR